MPQKKKPKKKVSSFYASRKWKSKYVDKAVMKMKPDEAGSDSDIGIESILKNTQNDVWCIRACGVVKIWRKLSLRWWFVKHKREKDSCCKKITKRRHFPFEEKLVSVVWRSTLASAWLVALYLYNLSTSQKSNMKIRKDWAVRLNPLVNVNSIRWKKLRKTSKVCPSWQQDLHRLEIDI